MGVANNLMADVGGRWSDPRLNPCVEVSECHTSVRAHSQYLLHIIAGRKRFVQMPSRQQLQQRCLS